LPGYKPDITPGFGPDISKNSPGLRPDKLPVFIPDISGDHPGKLSGKHLGKILSNLFEFYPC